MVRMILEKIYIRYHKLNQPYLAVLYTTIISTMYHRLHHIGEATSGSHLILAKDVQIADNKKKFLLILRTSKMHWKNAPPQLIKISATATTDVNPHQPQAEATAKLPCPYLMLKYYSNIRGGFASNQEPFFIFTDGLPVTPYHVTSCMKKALKDVGFNKKLYSSHSLRSGRSCDLYALGVPINKIKKLGRWTSNAVYKYIRN